MIQKLPEIREDIKSGALNLIQISKVQKACRAHKKTTGQAVTFSLQREILNEIKNKTADQADLTLAQKLNFKIELETKGVVQKDESIRLEVTFSKDEMAVIERAREILSHKTGGDLKATVLEMAKRVIKESQPQAQKRTEAAKQNQFENKQNLFDESAQSYEKKSEQFTATVAVKGVKPSIRKQILRSHSGCEFKDLETGKTCGSKYFAEIDHILPRYLGGGNEPKNLRVLCKNHNIYRYQMRHNLREHNLPGLK